MFVKNVFETDEKEQLEKGISFSFKRTINEGLNQRFIAEVLLEGKVYKVSY